MPDHKRQHYVPRCYLKPFSLNAADAAINVFNITNRRSIRNAPIKGQCARNYLYGEDLRLEHILQSFEGEYARSLRSVQNIRGEIAPRDIETMRGFSYLQYARTEMAMQRTKMLQEGLHNTIYNGRNVTPPDLDVSDRAVMLHSMLMYAKTRENIDDLKVCLIRNVSEVEFMIGPH